MGIWKCKFHPDITWKATFFERSHGRGGCPICKNFNYAIKLKDEFPEFKKYFDEKKISVHLKVMQRKVMNMFIGSVL